MIKSYSIILATICLLLFGCDGNSEFTLRTELLVEVRDEAGNPQPNATVTLYRSRLDLETRVQSVASVTSNAQGIAYFEDIGSEIYYVLATYDDGQLFYDNRDDHTIGPPLVEGSVSYYFTTLSERRPSQPSGFVVSEVWIMDYPTTASDDNPNIETAPDIYMELSYDDAPYNSYGPISFFRATFGGGILQREADYASADFSLNEIPASDLLSESLFGLELLDAERNQLYTTEADLIEALSIAQTPYPNRVRIVNEFNEEGNPIVIDFFVEWQ